MTTYILFYAIHTKLNTIIHRMSQKELLKCVSILVIMYCGVGTVKEGLLYENSLVCFITIYFIICYMKTFMPKFMESTKSNCLMLATGVMVTTALFFMTDFAGLKVSALSEQLLHWNRNNNPALIMIAIALFNLVRKCHFVNPFINYISSLSLLIYIIHENHIVRAYLRSMIWKMLYFYYGHEHLIIQVILYSLILFILTALISMLYQNTIMKFTSLVGDKLCIWMNRMYTRFYVVVRKWT